MKRLSDVCSVCCIIFFIFLYFLPLFYPSQNIIVTPDFGTNDALSSLSYKYIYWQSLQKNILPFWTSLYGNGFPLIAHGTVGAFFLPNLVLYKFLPFISAYSLSLVFSIILLGVGTYFFLKHITGHRVSSLFGALFLASSGLVVTQLTHISVIATASLLPWVLLSAHWVAEKFSPFRLLVFVFISSQQIFAGFPQMTFMSHLFACAYIICQNSPVPRSKRIMRLFFSEILSLLAAGPQLILSIEYFRSLTSSQGFSPDSATLFSFPYKHIRTFIFPFYFGNPATGTYPHFQAFNGSIFWENTGYIGIVPLAVIILSPLTKIRQKNPLFADGPLLFFAFTCFIALLLMAGNDSPLYILYSFFPFTLFRVPSRFIWIFTFSLVALFSCTLSELFRKKNSALSFYLFVLLFLNLFHLTWTFRSYHAVSSPQQFISSSLNVQKAQKAYDIGIQHLHNSVFLSTGWTDMRPFETLQLGQTPDASALHAVGQFLDTAGRDMKRTALIRSYIEENSTASTQSARIRSHAEKILALYGVDTITSAVPLSSTIYKEDLPVQKHGISIHSYKNPSVSPRLSIASSSTPIKTFSDFVENVERDSFNPLSDALVEQDIQIHAKTGTAPQIKILQENDQAISALVEQDEASLLVHNQLFYPGWSVTIDGASAKLFPANILSQAVFVPGGTHTVTFSYDPIYVKPALVLSFLIFAAIAIQGVLRLFSFHFRIGA